MKKNNLTTSKFILYLLLLVFILQKTLLFSYNSWIVIFYFIMFVIEYNRRSINVLSIHLLILFTNSIGVFLYVGMLSIVTIFKLELNYKNMTQYLMVFFAASYFFVMTITNYQNPTSLVRFGLILGIPMTYLFFAQSYLINIDKSKITSSVNQVLIALLIGQYINPTFINRQSVLIGSFSLSVIVVLILLYFSFYKILTEKKTITIKWLVFIILFSIQAVFSGSKTGTIFLILFLIYFLLLKSKMRTFNVVLIVLVGLSVFNVFENLNLLVQRSLFFVDYFSSNAGDFYEYAFSGTIRDRLFHEGIQYLSNKSDWLIGVGSVTPMLIESKSFHNSYLDFLLTYGLIGFLMFSILNKEVFKRHLKKHHFIFMIFFGYIIFQPYLFSVVAYGTFWYILTLFSLEECEKNRTQITTYSN